MNEHRAKPEIRPPRTLSLIIREYEEVARSIGYAIGDFLDDFYANPALRAGMLVGEPPLVTYSREKRATAEQINAYLAAMAEHLATRYGVPVPAWVEKPERFLKEPYYFGYTEPQFIAALQEESPPAFRRRNIFTEAMPLRRKSMPRTVEEWRAERPYPPRNPIYREEWEQLTGRAPAQPPPPLLLIPSRSF